MVLVLLDSYNHRNHGGAMVSKKEFTPHARIAEGKRARARLAINGDATVNLSRDTRARVSVKRGGKHG